MPSREIKIINKLGLHLRAAASFVQLADAYPCRIWIHKDGRRVNGKSILSVLSVGAPVGEEIRIETSGERETEALEALVKLVSGGFGEDN